MVFTRRISSIIVAVLLVVCIGYAGHIAANYFRIAGPRVDISPTLWDFGNVSPGQRLEARIRIANSGRRPLLIESIDTTCGCVATELPSEVILPGSLADMKVVMMAAQYRRKISQSILVVTNDPARAQVVIKLTGMVVTPLDFFPPDLNFGVLKSEDLPSVRELRVTPGKDSIRLSNYTWSVETNDINGFVEANVGVPGTDRDELVVKAVLEKNIVPGPLNCEIAVIGSQAGVERLRRTVSCLGRVLGEVGVTPDSILLDPTNTSGPAAKVASLEIVRGNEQMLDAAVSESLDGLVKLVLRGRSLRVEILPDLRSTSNRAKLKKLAKIRGTVWLIDRQTGSKVLGIPVIIVGRQ